MNTFYTWYRNRERYPETEAEAEHVGLLIGITTKLARLMIPMLSFAVIRPSSFESLRNKAWTNEEAI